MKYTNLPIGEIIEDNLGIEWKRTNIRDTTSTYEDNYYYMPVECHCNVECGGSYTIQDEHGDCDYCCSVIRQINGHNDDIGVDFDDAKLFVDTTCKR